MEKERGITIINVDDKKQCDIHVVSNTEGKLLCEDCNKVDRYLVFRVCEPCLIKGKYIAK
jgi:hypothetical protein